MLLPAALPRFQQTQNVEGKPEPKEAGKGKDPEAGLNLKGVRVLVVEDDPDTLELLDDRIPRVPPRIHLVPDEREQAIDAAAQNDGAAIRRQERQAALRIVEWFVGAHAAATAVCGAGVVVFGAL